MKNIIFYLSILIITSSCAITKKTAPIEYHYGNQQVKKTTKTVFKEKPIIDEDEGEIIDNTHIKHEIVEEKKTDEIKIHDENDDDQIISISTEEKIETKEHFTYYEVEESDTIEKIVQKYNVSIEEITKENDLTPPYSFDEHQILKIPTAKEIIKTTKIIDDNDDTNIMDEEVKPLVKEQNVIVTKTVTAEFISPLNGKIIANFGDKTDNGINKGIIIAAKAGTKILASATGKVIYADYDATFGNLIIIKLNNNIVTSYAHMQDIILKKGSMVNQGDVVGYVGSTGKVTQPSLHFGIREGKSAKNPMKYINF